MKCLECKNFDMQSLKDEPLEMRKTGWAQCKEGKFYGDPNNGERVNGIMDRDSCYLGQFERLDDDLIAERCKYYGVKNGD